MPVPARRVDRQLLPVFLGQMLDRSDENPSPQQELLLCLFEASPVPGEIGPIGFLPIPGHER
jgi:hypothetical protein